MLVYCGKFDTDLKLTSDPCGANDIDPMVGYQAAITTVNPKFGAGCIIGVNYSLYIHWHPAGGFPGIPGNTGTVGFWFRSDGTFQWSELLLRNALGGDASKIDITCHWDKSGTGDYEVILSMWDSAGTIVINNIIAPTGIPGDYDWHYLELNWTWNDVSGNTELSLDGVVQIADEGGDSESRDGDDTTWIQFLSDDDIADGPAHDDLAIYDTREHSGNFTVPATVQCVCAVVSPLDRATLGSPLGMPNPLGR